MTIIKDIIRFLEWCFIPRNIIGIEPNFTAVAFYKGLGFKLVERKCVVCGKRYWVRFRKKENTWPTCLAWLCFRDYKRGI